MKPQQGNPIQQIRSTQPNKGQSSEKSIRSNLAGVRTPSTDGLEISETECDRERQIVPPPRSYSDAKYKGGRGPLDYSIAV